MYAGIKNWQAHGSIYDNRPGTTRLPRSPSVSGTTKRSTPTATTSAIVLNGKTIIDADLSKLADKDDPKGIGGGKHPGLFREKGYIGFLGHGHRIEFRNIRLKEL